MYGPSLMSPRKNTPRSMVMATLCPARPLMAFVHADALAAADRTGRIARFELASYFGDG